MEEPPLETGALKVTVAWPSPAAADVMIGAPRAVEVGLMVVEPSAFV